MTGPEVVQKLTEVEEALGRVASMLQEAARRGGWVMVDEARDGVVESQARIVLLLADLSRSGPSSPPPPGPAVVPGWWPSLDSSPNRG